MEGQEDRIRIPVYGNSVFDSGVAVNDFSQRGLREQFINCLSYPSDMPTRSALAKCQRQLHYFTLASPASDIYLDLAEGLSRQNRKLFEQGRNYCVKNLTANWVNDTTYDTLSIQVITAGDTWPVHNAWVKAKALHTEMQDLVLDDNPTISGKWSDFKVYLDADHLLGNKQFPHGPNGDIVIGGEWQYSTYVMPQHDVDGGGLPLPALEYTAHLVGDDTPTGRGLVLAYQNSRATVQTNAPNVPIGFEQSFFNLLTDSGSQEPELAAVIIDENDQPPYATADYPGGNINVAGGFFQHRRVTNRESPNLVIPTFTAQCGLVHIRVQAYLAGEIVSPAPAITFSVEMSPGDYKGVKAPVMGQ